MPGLTPFLEALRQPAYVCTNCGFWQRHFEAPPSCPLCLDARHVVPADGWRFLDCAEAQAAWPTRFEELEPGAWRFWNEPVEGIGPSGYLLTNAGGNVFFESCSVFDEAALAKIDSLGGIRVLSASHPHSYGALWQLQDRFEPELALPAADFAWSAALRITWPWDDHLEICPDSMFIGPVATSKAMRCSSIERGGCCFAAMPSSSSSIRPTVAARPPPRHTRLSCEACL